MKRYFTEEQDAAILCRYAGGESSKAIARCFGTSGMNVLASLRRSGAEIRVGTHSVNRSLREDAFAEPLSDDAYYWAGFLLADGCVLDGGGSRKPAQVKLCVQTRDVDILEEFRRFVGSGSKIGPSNWQGSAYNIVVSSAVLAESLGRLGVTPRKSLTAQPAEACRVNRHFWRGVIDGDGSLGWTRKRYPVLSIAGSAGVVDSFCAYMRLLCPTCRIKKTPNGRVYSAMTAGSYAKKVAEHLYDGATVCLRRKAAIVADFSRWRCRERKRG